MFRYYKNKSINAQLRLIISLCAVISFAVIATVAYLDASKVLLENTLKDHQSKVESLAHSMGQQYSAYLETTERLFNTLENGYLDGLTFSSNQASFNGYQVEDAKLNGESLVNSTKTVDAFTKDTGAVATLFLPVKNDWLRISTSLKNLQGERVMGTMLGVNHPGYKTIMTGQSFVAQVMLFGKRYITYYKGIRDNSGVLRAVLFIGYPVEDAAETLFESLAKVSWGESGHTLVVDDHPATKGHFLLGASEFNNVNSILDMRDVQGNNTFEPAFNQDTGILTFTDSAGNERYTVYSNIPGWGWKLLGGTTIAEVTQASQTLLQKIVVISLIVGAAMIAVVTLFLNYSCKPLTQLAQVMERLGLGEISQTVSKGDENSKNEIIRLSNSVAVMIEKLNALVGDIRDTSDRVNSGSSDVSSDANNNLTQADQQQNQVEQMVTAIEEMATSAQNVAEQVENIASNVRDADTSTQSGLDLVESVCIDVAQLNDQLIRSSSAISQVSSDSESIQTVTRMIDEIAEQTNLLALNAAIEAARAGEQGRGFAVVADEVRTLAHRTQTSVKDVVSIIAKLKESTNNAVDLMTQSQDSATAVLDKSQEAGAALENITEQVRSIAQQAEAIAATAEEQAHVSQEIAANASEVSELNGSSREVTAKTARSATELSQLADNLKQQINFFH